MTKGSETFEEVVACIKTLNDELSSGWSQSAITVALIRAMTVWLTAESMKGMPVRSLLKDVSGVLERSVEAELADLAARGIAIPAATGRH
jgi:hypothetical protein